MSAPANCRSCNPPSATRENRRMAAPKACILLRAVAWIALASGRAEAGAEVKTLQGFPPEHCREAPALLIR